MDEDEAAARAWARKWLCVPTPADVKRAEELAREHGLLTDEGYVWEREPPASISPPLVPPTPG